MPVLLKQAQARVPVLLKHEYLALLWAGGGGGFSCVRGVRRGRRSGVRGREDIGGGHAGNEAGAAAEGEIFESPLNEDNDAALKFDDVHQMDEEPDEPGEQAGDLEAKNIGYSGGTSDVGHVAFVEIVERLAGGLASEASADGFGGIQATLNGDLSNAGEGISIFG